MDSTKANDDFRPHRQRRRQQSRFVLWVALVGVAIGSVAVLYMILSKRATAGADMPEYSVYSDGPDGFAQAAALLRNLGWQPVAVTRPIQQTHHRGLLILAESMDPLPGLGIAPKLSDNDVDNLLDWVKQGNTLLFLSPENTRLSEKLGVNIIEAARRDDTIYQAKPGAVGEYTARVDRVGLERTSTVSGRKSVPLWWLGDRPAAVAVQHGAGRILIVPDPSVLTHRGLRREDNAVFLYNLAALDAEEGRVYFDEYHHGIRSSGGLWSYLRYHGQHWIILQLVLVALMALWANGRRLGPATPIPVTKTADGVDYASSVARIYQKAEVRPLVAGILARHFFGGVTGHLRLRRSAPCVEILAEWRQRHGERSAHVLGHLLDAAEDLRNGRKVGSEQLLGLAQRFDSFLTQQVRSKIAT
jgi:hypothetical protein